jgi:hypothetical protein
MRLGVLSDGLVTSPTADPPVYFCAVQLPTIAGPNAGLFLSVANLQGAERINTCYVGKRCTGLLIHYLQKASVVLGQWYSNNARHSIIYERSQGEPRTIYFKMTSARTYGFVTDIGFSLDMSFAGSTSEYQVIDFREVTLITCYL